MKLARSGFTNLYRDYSLLYSDDDDDDDDVPSLVTDDSEDDWDVGWRFEQNPEEVEQNQKKLNKIQKKLFLLIGIILHF